MACPAADMSTLSAPLAVGDLLNFSAVKVVSAPSKCDSRKDQLSFDTERALFFSRAPIGVDRELLFSLLNANRDNVELVGNKVQSMVEQNTNSYACRLHIGVYAFRWKVLQRFVELSPSRLELLERLEQMRALEAGMHIVVSRVAHHSKGVDTLDDLEAIRRQPYVRPS